MQCLQRTLHGIGSQLACNRTTHVAFSKVIACPEVFTLVPNLLSSGGGKTTSIFQESAGHAEQYSFLLPPILSRNTQENKLPICRELRVPNVGISQYGTIGNNASFRGMITASHQEPSSGQGSAAVTPDAAQPQRIKFKRLDKTAKHIMNILDKEAVDKVQADRVIPDIKPGYIIQLKVEVPENKRRVSTLKGIVIARRNAGLNSTFRLRRLVAGVGVESVFPLYSPNIKEMKVLDKKNVRRAKLYYLRDRMNALKK